MRLELSSQATDDIELLHQNGVMTFGLLQATRYTSGLLDILDLISADPEMAKVRPEFNRQPRMIRYKSHVLLYRI